MCWIGFGGGGGGVFRSVIFWLWSQGSYPDDLRSVWHFRSQWTVLHGQDQNRVLDQHSYSQTLYEHTAPPPVSSPSGLVSMCTLTLLAYERYIVVCKPMAGFKMNVRRSFQGLLGVWLFCLFWAVPPLLGWSSYGPEGVQTSCSLGWEERPV